MTLEIRGTHDPRTIAQMERCMAHPAALNGVLCADGHLGYGHPIGGVIEYENHVSVTGVGFDIGCVDGETEFLSPGGWVRIDNWSGEQVAQYDADTGISIFVDPINYISKPATSWVKIKNKYGVDQRLSPDHRMLVYAPRAGRKFNNWIVFTARQFADRHSATVQGHDYRINTSFTIERDTELPFADEELRVIIMTCADAFMERRQGGDHNGIAVLSLKKKRKIERAENLLRAAQVNFSRSGPNARGYITFRYVPPLFTKTLGDLWDCSPEQLTIVAEEVLMWDGNSKDRVFFTRDKDSADFIHYAFAATGYRSVMRKDDEDYRVFAQRNTKVGVKSVPKTPISEEPAASGERQYCFTVPTGFFVIRRGGQIALTGNCGNLAVKLGCHINEINLEQLADQIALNISFGVGRVNNQRVESGIFDFCQWRDDPFLKGLKDMAVNQFGTVGGGNHFVNIMEDAADGRVWIAVHFGSRGLGHTIAKHFLKLAGGKDGMDVEPTVLPLDSHLGERYVRAAGLAQAYAYQARDWVVNRVQRMIDDWIDIYVHNHHNFFDNIGGRRITIRKGATRNSPNLNSFIGGSMGDESYIVVGRNFKLLESTIHGAGRTMSRRDAKRTFTHDEWNAWMKEKQVHVRGGDLDESPMAYRRLDEVIQHHLDTVEITHRLKPRIVVMSGNGVIDPYKD